MTKLTISRINNMTVNYRDYQAFLRDARDAGFTLNCKLSAKYEVIRAEYNRVAEVIKSEHARNEKLVKQTQHETRVREAAPSCKLPLSTPLTCDADVPSSDVYEKLQAIADRKEDISHVYPKFDDAVRTPLEGQYTEFTCDVCNYQQSPVKRPTSRPVKSGKKHIDAAKYNAPTRANVSNNFDRRTRVSHARVATPIVNTSANLPKVACHYSKNVNPYFVDTNTSRYVRDLDDTCKQAVRNLQDGVNNVIAFAKGFHQGCVSASSGQRRAA